MAKFDVAAGIMYINVNECNRLSIIIIGDPLLPYSILPLLQCGLSMAVFNDSNQGQPNVLV